MNSDHQDADYAAKPPILIVSLTQLNREPRVIRQMNSLAKKSFLPIGAGFHDPSNPPLDHLFVDLEPTGVKNPSDEIISTGETQKESGGLIQRVKTAVIPDDRDLQILLGRAHSLIPLQFFREVFAGFYIWQLRRRVERFVPLIDKFLEVNRIEPAGVIAHDPRGILVAQGVAKACNKPLMADLHEHFPSQYSFLPAWSKSAAALMDSVMKSLLSECQAISTVSAGILEAYRPLLSESTLTAVVRSVQDVVSFRPSPTKQLVRVIYSGAITEGRGLDVVIRSVSTWPTGFTLTIMGPAESEYLQQLGYLTTKLGLDARVSYRTAVPFVDLVRTLSEYDIGIFVQPDSGVQKKYTLPNKFFDYIAAGLALCVSDYPEMAKIVHEAKNGILIKNLDARELSGKISALSIAEIDQFKEASRALAGTVNWENEEKIFLKLMARLVETERA